MEKLRHPGIATVFRTGIEQDADVDIPYIVMEYVEGETLKARLAQGRTDPDRDAQVLGEASQPQDHRVFVQGAKLGAQETAGLLHQIGALRGQDNLRPLGRRLTDQRFNMLERGLEGRRCPGLDEGEPHGSLTCQQAIKPPGPVQG